MGVRRAALLTLSVGLAISSALLGTTTVGAAPHHTKLPGATAAKSKQSFLTGISVVPKSSTAWAFGLHGSLTHQTPYAIVGSGKHWKSVAIKVSPQAELVSIAAGSAKSIWIVGSLFKNGVDSPVIEHSSGGAFTAMKVPKLGKGTLTAVSASAANNAWAIGTNEAGAYVVDRWNGKAWKNQPLGSALSGFILNAISTSSPSNVWIAAVSQSANVPLGLRWNGHAFTQVLADSKDVTGTFPAIATTSPKTVWMVGYRGKTVKGVPVEVATTERLKGSRFVDVKAPSPGLSAFPASVAIVGSKAYLVGQQQSTKKTSPLAEEFNGGKWKVQHTVGGGQTSLLGSVSASKKVVVAAGTLDAAEGRSGGGKSLVEVLHGKSWRQEKVPA